MRAEYSDTPATGFVQNVDYRRRAGMAQIRLGRGDPGAENPTGTVTFGIYRGEDRRIYTRDLY